MLWVRVHSALSELESWWLSGQMGLLSSPGSGKQCRGSSKLKKIWTGSSEPVAGVWMRGPLALGCMQGHNHLSFCPGSLLQQALLSRAEILLHFRLPRWGGQAVAAQCSQGTGDAFFHELPAPEWPGSRGCGCKLGLVTEHFWLSGFFLFSEGHVHQAYAVAIQRWIRAGGFISQAIQ